MSAAHQCPTCGDEDGVCLCGPPVPTVARVPLRPEAAMVPIRRHMDHRRDLLRVAAESDAAAKKTDDPWWRDTLTTGARERRAEAAEHETIAAMWARRVGL